MSGECLLCENKLTLNLLENTPDQENSIIWKVWEKDESKKFSLISKWGTVIQLLGMLKDESAGFLFQFFIKRKQAASYKLMLVKCKEPNSSTGMLQMDYAENYTSLWQDECQTAHWNKKKTGNRSVYTAIVSRY